MRLLLLLAAAAAGLLASQAQAQTTIVTGGAQSPTGSNAASAPVCYGHWQSIGPFHATSVSPDLSAPQDIGAASDIWQVPSSETAYLATTNGGVWKTTTLHTPTAFGGPHWTALTDQMPCASISCIRGSQTDYTIIAAGCGAPSNSEGNRSSEARGVMVTFDAGVTWSMTNFPAGYEVRSLIVRGSASNYKLIVAASAGVRPLSSYTGRPVDSYGISTSRGGIWLAGSVDATQTLTLPVSQIAELSASSSILYAAVIVDQTWPSGPYSAPSWPVSLYRSTNTGASWAATTGTPISLVTCAAYASRIVNAQVAVVSATRIYAGFVFEPTNPNVNVTNVACNSTFYGLFYSTDDGVSWTTIANIQTAALSAGGTSNLVLLADATFPNILFVGGSGRAVFRVDTSTSTWTPMATTSDVLEADPTWSSSSSSTGASSSSSSSSSADSSTLDSSSSSGANCSSSTGSWNSSSSTGVDSSSSGNNNSSSSTGEASTDDDDSSSSSSGDDADDSMTRRRLLQVEDSSSSTGEDDFSSGDDSSSADSSTGAPSSSGDASSSSGNYSSSSNSSSSGYSSTIDSSSSSSGDSSSSSSGYSSSSSGLSSSSSSSTGAASISSTANLTAPGTGARALVLDAVTGELLIMHDSGISKRTAPLVASNLGDWSSLTGDLAITEVYQAALDPVSGAIIAGTNGNALMVSQLNGSEATTGVWSIYGRADGTSVGVNTASSPASFYSASSYLTNWTSLPVRGGVGSALKFSGTLSDSCSPGSSDCLSWLTPQAVNPTDTTQVLVCSNDDADTLCYSVGLLAAGFRWVATLEFTAADLSLPIDPFDQYVYGGSKNGVANSNVVFAVSRTFLWSRDIVSCALASCISVYKTTCTSTCKLSNSVRTTTPWNATGVNPTVSIAQHPNDYYSNVVVDNAGHAWITANFGQSWRDLNNASTSNLLAVSGHTSIDTIDVSAVHFFEVLISTNNSYPLIVGTPRGTFVTFAQPNSTYFKFFRLGSNMPFTFPTSYLYSAVNDTLVASTFGRGIWALQTASLVLTATARGNGNTTSNPRCLAPLYPNVPQASAYRADGFTLPIGFNLTIPAPYPILRFQLLGPIEDLPGGTVSTLADLLTVELASQCGVAAERVVILGVTPVVNYTIIGNVTTITTIVTNSTLNTTTLVNTTSQVNTTVYTDVVMVSFTLLERWIGSTSSELNTSDAVNLFLARAGDASSSLYSQSVLENTILFQTPLPTDSTASPLITNSTLSMAYTMDALPGGNVTAFSAMFVRDVARACNVSTRRVFVRTLQAGSVIANFSFTSAVDVTEASAQTALTTFTAAVSNSKSLLYNGALVTGAALVVVPTSSTGAGSTGTAVPLTASSKKGWFTTTVMIAIIASAVGAIALAALGIFCWKRRTTKFGGKSILPSSTSGRVELHAPRAFADLGCTEPHVPAEVAGRYHTMIGGVRVPVRR